MSKVKSEKSLDIRIHDETHVDINYFSHDKGT